jgi:hypothetical protein
MEIKTEALTLSASTGTLTLPVLTTTERDALTAETGMLIFNSTTGTINMYDGSGWVAIDHD